MSKNQDGRVWAYVAEGPDNLYFVVICANGAVYLPENSAYYFSYLPSLSILETEGLRTDYAKRMDNMFYSSSNSNLLVRSLKLDLSNWNVSNVENMHGMFSNFLREDVDLNSVTIDLSNWNLKKCKNLSYMFEDMLYGERDAINVKIKFDNWDTSNVENFDGMFECFGRYYKNPELEINGWVINGSVYHMFMNFGAYSTGIAHLKLSNITFNEGTELLMENGSGGNPENMILEFKNIKIKKTTKGMFRYVSTANPSTVIYNFYDWDTSEVTNMEGMFESDNFKELDLTSFDTSNVTSMKNMFSGFSNNGVKVYVSDKWSNAKLPANEAIFGSNLYGCPSRTSYPLRDNEYATYDGDGCFILNDFITDAAR
jgi:surface protein